MAKYLWVGSTAQSVDSYSFNYAGNWRVLSGVGAGATFSGTNGIPGPRDEVFVGIYNPASPTQPRGWIPARSPLLFGGFSGAEGPTGAGTWNNTGPTGTTTGSATYGNGLSLLQFQPFSTRYYATSGNQTTFVPTSYSFPYLGYGPNTNDTLVTNFIGGASLTAGTNFRAYTDGLKIKSDKIVVGSFSTEYITAGTTFSSMGLSHAWKDGGSHYIKCVASSLNGDELTVYDEQSTATVEGGKWSDATISSFGMSYDLTGNIFGNLYSDKAGRFIGTGEGLVLKNAAVINCQILNGAAHDISMIGCTAFSVRIYTGDGNAFVGASAAGVETVGYVPTVGSRTYLIGTSVTASAYTLVAPGITTQQPTNAEVVFQGPNNDEEVGDPALLSVFNPLENGVFNELILGSLTSNSGPYIHHIDVVSGNEKAYPTPPFIKPALVFDSNATVRSVNAVNAYILSSPNITIDSTVNIGECVLGKNAVLDFDNQNSNFDDWRFGSISGSNINGGVVFTDASAQVLGSPGVRLWNTQTKAGVYNKRSSSTSDIGNSLA